jgi:hypothetical protein
MIFKTYNQVRNNLQKQLPPASFLKAGHKSIGFGFGLSAQIWPKKISQPFGWLMAIKRVVRREERAFRLSRGVTP